MKDEFRKWKIEIGGNRVFSDLCFDWLLETWTCGVALEQDQRANDTRAAFEERVTVLRVAYVASDGCKATDAGRRRWRGGRRVYFPK